MVSLLQQMGFSENACKRAVIAVDSQNIEQASNWLFQHLDDANLNDPIDLEPEKKKPLILMKILYKC